MWSWKRSMAGRAGGRFAYVKSYIIEPLLWDRLLLAFVLYLDCFVSVLLFLFHSRFRFFCSLSAPESKEGVQVECADRKERPLGAHR